MSSSGKRIDGDKKRGDGIYNRTPSKDGPSNNTRSGGKRDSRDQRQQGQIAMDVDDTYNHGSSAMQLGNHGGYQQHNVHMGQPSHVGQPHHQQIAHGMRQQQSQRHIFRNAQASKQMVYEVYGNTIAMLEEVEARDMANKGLKPMPRSDIYVPSQQKYDDSTCIRKLETQLLLFQSQMTSCDQEIRQEVRDELTEKTVMWNSIREHQQVPKGVTDTYVGKLIEVLTQGKTEHPKEFYEKPKISETEMKGAMQGIMQGQQRQVALDDDYRKNPDKKAQAPNIRSGGMIDSGAERVSRNDPHLSGKMGQYNKSIL